MYHAGCQSLETQGAALRTCLHQVICYKGQGQRIQRRARGSPGFAAAPGSGSTCAAEQATSLQAVVMQRVCTGPLQSTQLTNQPCPAAVDIALQTELCSVLDQF